MEGLTAFFWMILGLAVRFGLPVALTILVMVGLRKLDETWQSSAGAPRLAMARVKVENSGCWKTKGCSEEMRSQCEAYNCKDMPCWQVFRDDRGYLKSTCLGCEVFKSAPEPA